MRIRLGNSAPIGADIDGNPLVGPLVTEVIVPDGESIPAVIQILTSPEGVWAAHSSQPPTWLECSDPNAENVLRYVFGDIGGEGVSDEG